MPNDAGEEAELELLAMVRRWQDKHDVRPSELVKSLSKIIEAVKPKALKE